jgi:hypothetical protein
LGDDRRDDWHNSVEERLVNLNSAQGTTDLAISGIEKQLSEIDNILRGEPANNIESLVENVNALKTDMRKVNRVFFDKDYLGHGDGVSFLIFLYNQEKTRQKESDARSGYKWGFWTAVVVAVIGLAGLVITNKDQIEKWWPHDHPAPLEAAIEKAKRP